MDENSTQKLLKEEPMTKSSSLIVSLIACFLGISLAACTAGAPLTSAVGPSPSTTPPSAPPALTATPLLKTTPLGISGTPPLISATGGFFALSVADIQASAKWYSEKFDLKIVSQPPPTNQSSVIVLEGDGFIVELIQHDGAVSLSEITPTIKDKTLLRGIVKAGIIIDNFDQTLAMLRKRGVSIAFGPYPATANQKANVIIQDNEGNLIQFFGK